MVVVFFVFQFKFTDTYKQTAPSIMSFWSLSFSSYPFLSFPFLYLVCVTVRKPSTSTAKYTIDANGTLSHSRLAEMKPCSLTFHIYHWILCSYFPVCVSMPVHVLSSLPLCSSVVVFHIYIFKFVRLFSAHTEQVSQ